MVTIGVMEGVVGVAGNGDWRWSFERQWNRDFFSFFSSPHMLGVWGFY